MTRGAAGWRWPAVVGLALVLAVVWQAGHVGATRYCAYHPEAPECEAYLLTHPHYRYSNPWTNDVVLPPPEDDGRSSPTCTPSSAPAGAPASGSNEQIMPIAQSNDTSTAEPVDDGHEPAALPWLHALDFHRSGWRLLQAFAVVVVGALVYVWIGRRESQRLARDIELASTPEALEALLERCGDESSQSANRRSIEVKLASVQHDQQVQIKDDSTQLQTKLDIATRKREFFKRWRRAQCKTRSIAELEDLAREADEVESTLAPVIKDWLRLRKEFDQQSSTLRLTNGEEADASISPLSHSGRLRLYAASASTRHFENDTICIAGEVSVENEQESNHEDIKATEDENTESGQIICVAASGVGTDLVPLEGERSFAKRRSAHLHNFVMENYEPAGGVERAIRHQTESDAQFRSQELLFSEAHLMIKLQKLRQEEEKRIEDQERQEREDEERRKQNRKKLKEQQKLNKIKMQDLKRKREETRRILAEADERRTWNSLKSKLFIHVLIYGVIALYHLWHRILESWQTSLDFSSICTPQIILVPGRVCLPDLAAYLPLHVFLPCIACFLVLAIRWGGTLLQLVAFSALPMIFFLIWSKIPSSSDLVGLVAVIAAQLLIYALKKVLLWYNLSSADPAPPSQAAPIRYAWTLLAAGEILLFLVNAGVALAVFSRRQDGVHDSLADCFATPSDFGSCYAYY